MVLCNTHKSDNSQMTQNMVIAWIQAHVLFPHIFIGIKDISFIEQLPQTIDLSVKAFKICS